MVTLVINHFIRESILTVKMKQQLKCKSIFPSLRLEWNIVYSSLRKRQKNITNYQVYKSKISVRDSRVTSALMRNYEKPEFSLFARHRRKSSRNDVFCLRTWKRIFDAGGTCGISGISSYRQWGISGMENANNVWLFDTHRVGEKQAYEYLRLRWWFTASSSIFWSHALSEWMDC